MQATNLLHAYANNEYILKIFGLQALQVFLPIGPLEEMLEYK